MGMLKNPIHSLSRYSLVLKISTKTLRFVNCSSFLLGFEIANFMLAHIIGRIIVNQNALKYDDSNLEKHTSFMTA